MLVVPHSSAESTDLFWYGFVKTVFPIGQVDLHFEVKAAFLLFVKCLIRTTNLHISVDVIFAFDRVLQYLMDENFTLRKYPAYTKRD